MTQDLNYPLPYAFSHEALTKFCKQGRELLLKRRWPERRLEFIREYIFAPKHADLLDSRECKRAREAQAEQEGHGYFRYSSWPKRTSLAIFATERTASHGLHSRPEAALGFLRQFSRRYQRSL
jgi:hypothetical protein